MASLAKAVTTAAVLFVTSLSVVAAESSAAPPPAGAKVSAAAKRALNEIAAEAGYKSWSAYRGAREAEAARLQKEAARIIADALTYGRRVVERVIKLDNGVEVRGITEWIIDFENGQFLLRTGLEIVYPDRIEETTTYWGGRSVDKLGSATTVTKDGLRTVVTVVEFVPGSIDLKPGDTSPVPKPSTSAAGTRPSSLDPKADGSLGRASGGTSPLGGILDAMIAQADRDRQDGNNGSPGAETGSQEDEEPESGAEPAPSSEAGGSKLDDKSTEQKPSVIWGETSTDEDGNKYTGFEVTNEDGTTTIGTKTEHTDGSVTCHTMTKDGEQESACPSGMTDEPSCRSGCERLTFLAGIFCVGCDVYVALPTKGSSYGTRATEYSLRLGNAVYTSWPILMDLDKPGGPLDYGDPNDPNAEAPVDWGNMFADPRTDGVLDPADPGECAEFLENSIIRAMAGTLRDPVNPPGTDDEGPAPGGPNPGDDE